MFVCVCVCKCMYCNCIGNRKKKPLGASLNLIVLEQQLATGGAHGVLRVYATR